MRKFLLILGIAVVASSAICAGKITKPNSDVKLKVKGLHISPPKSADLDKFVDFIEKDLKKEGVNTLVLNFNYKYKFKKYPQLAQKGALSEKEIKRLVKACRKSNIKLIPLVNSFGHQSWMKRNTKQILKAFPELEENPGIKYESKDFYCKSLCPRHPKLHEILFSALDELIEVFETDIIHLGMDEVFIISEESCKRCSGSDPSETFAFHVNNCNAYFKKKGVKMWIWGDRMIDGRTTGLGMWQSSMNNTHKSIDLVDKDVVICDWHYVEAPPTASYFALKGFNVISCPYQNAWVGQAQLNEQISVQRNSKRLAPRMNGVMQTVWGSYNQFIDSYHGKNTNETMNGAAKCFKEMFKAIRDQGY